jgi:predicted ribosome quality control (RQC) complex YloA/Tae2 family protein
VLAVAQALQELWAPVHTGAWQPGLIEEGATEKGDTEKGDTEKGATEKGATEKGATEKGATEKGATIVGFAAYPVHFRGRFSAQPSMSAALARYFAESDVTRAVDTYAAQRAQVQAQVKRAQLQVARRLAALAGDEPAPGAAEALRTQANWLLALSSQVQPGQTILEVDTGDEPLHIELDALYTPIEQAQRMFKRAAKLERAALAIPRRRAELLADRALLEQLALDGERAANQPELAAVVDELQHAGFGRAAASHARRPTAPARGPLRFRTQHGAEIVVGRNARQNEQVTFKLARPDDAWLHVRGTPGAHVIVRSPSHAPDARDLQAAAQLAAYHSSVRGERRVDVIVTERRWVSRAPGGRTGQVVVTRERVLSVPAEEPETLIPLTGQKE